MMTLEQVVAAEAAIGRLVAVPLRADAAVRVAGIARQVAEAGRRAHDGRDALVDRYAQRDAEGALVAAEKAPGMIRIDPAHRSEFERELRSLLDEEVEIRGGPLTVADLRRENGELAGIPPAVLLALGPLFSDG